MPVDLFVKKEKTVSSTLNTKTINSVLLEDQPHRRFNPLNGQWVLVSPHRSKRPWSGQVETEPNDKLKQHDEGCYLCPGNTRVSGEENPHYEGVYSFSNDHAALIHSDQPFDRDISGLLRAKSESGTCRVICFTPRHDLTLATMSVDEIEKVVDLWTSEYQSLSTQSHINYVQIFENKGAAMGCSNPHPHGQIWAQESIPTEPLAELKRMSAYYSENNGRPLLMDYLKLELKEKERLVCENDDFVVVVPFWATWPFETLVLPKEQVSSLLELNESQARSLAGIVKSLTVKYDNLFNTSFPYSSGIHQAPVNEQDYPECTLHMHYYPPLLRSAQIKKFMVGYEMMAESQRDITPEKAAEVLRNASTTHYLDKTK